MDAAAKLLRERIEYILDYFGEAFALHSRHLCEPTPTSPYFRTARLSIPPTMKETGAPGDDFRPAVPGISVSRKSEFCDTLAARNPKP
jgi:hypothetical protein